MILCKILVFIVPDLNGSIIETAPSTLPSIDGPMMTRIHFNYILMRLLFYS